MTTTARGGAEFAAIEMLDALAERGHDVVMVTNDPAIVRDRRVRAVPVDIGEKLSLRSWKGLLAQWPRLVLRLRRALASEEPYDVLLLHYKKEQLMSLCLRRSLRRTTVWIEWGPVPFPLRQSIPRLAYLAAARRAALVMAVSEGTKHSVAAVGVPDDKICVVDNVVRDDEIGFTAEGRGRVRRELGIPPDAFVVGCISRFHPKKRNDVVIDAVARLPPVVHLILAGDGESEADLRQRGEPLGDRFHVLPTPTSDVADVLSAFDVSVFCPSPTEGQPRAVIIAMLAERPALATGAEGVADMIEPGIGEITTPENDPDALASTLRGYLEDPQRVATEGRTARGRAVQRYSAPAVAERIERLLQRVRST